MQKHPAGPFTVRVSTYSLEQGNVGGDRFAVYASRHRSPHGAARRLASIIAGKSTLARLAQFSIGRGRGGSFLIELGDGTKLALNTFRSKFC